MDRNAITASILLFLMVSNVASSSFSKLRYLADESPSKNDTIATAATPPSTPLPNPLTGSGDKKLDPKRDNSTKLDPDSSNKTDSVTPNPVDKKNPKPLGKPEKVNPSTQKEIASGNDSNLTSTPKDDKTMEGNGKKKNADNGKNSNSTNTDKGGYTKEDKETKKKNADENNSKPGIAETCDGIVSRCEDQSSLTACIKDFGTGSNELVVLVHNRGENFLNVKLAGPYGASFPKRLRVPEHGTKMINISLTSSKPGAMVLTAGNGDCELPLDAYASKIYFFSKLPSYNKLLTPVNGAYFLIVAVVIFAGSWACCIFRKSRRHDDGVPYQELEMGMPESTAATNVETAEGWDQDWDDDWDEDKAVRSPVGRNVASSISANGLTARSSNRDGWESDWSD
ncbi:hypothetical protein like AT3G51580 [Hibiscus trionum]|uniref:DUF7356 domain-containing protein n=1 Tax=Hibiscus trionum TaxID=183268 RepID=A0A9W7GSY1_HIBTR|nr:hypothetical protein like AT3G51580 [Hibiscus trionum]